MNPTYIHKQHKLNIKKGSWINHPNESSNIYWNKFTGIIKTPHEYLSGLLGKTRVSPIYVIKYDDEIKDEEDYPMVNEPTT